MVMVSARLTRRWRLSYRHDLTNAAIAAARVASSRAPRSVCGRCAFGLNRGVGRPAASMLRRHPILCIHVRPERSIFSNALNFRCSAIAAFVRSP